MELAIIGLFGCIISIFMLFLGFIKKCNNHKKCLARLIIFILMFLIGILSDDTPTNKATTDSPDKLEINKSEENLYDFQMELSATIQDKSALITINANAVDGSIINVRIKSPSCDDFDTKAVDVEIKNGKGQCSFNLKDWPLGNSTLVGSMDLSKQPANVIEAYGIRGEKLKTINRIVECPDVSSYLLKKSETIDTSVHVLTNTVKIAYPSREKLDSLLNDVLNDIIKSSGKIIIDIKPRYSKTDWSCIDITICDQWYSEPYYEKERLIESLGKAMRLLVRRYANVNNDKHIEVYFYDRFHKVLASSYYDGNYIITR